MAQTMQMGSRRALIQLFTWGLECAFAVVGP